MLFKLHFRLSHLNCVRMKKVRWWSSISTIIRTAKAIKTKLRIKMIENNAVSNTVGSSGDKGSKKAYWEKKTSEQFSSCQISGCENKARVGGHVWVQGFHSTQVVYILPMCQVSSRLIISPPSIYDICRRVTRTGAWTTRTPPSPRTPPSL